MTDPPTPDWDPTAAATLRDQAAAYDEMRRRCPVAYSELLGWSLFRHADVARALAEPDAFSNVVSGHRSVPNGMDPPEHTAYRAVIEPYFTHDRMRAFEPGCRQIAGELIESLAIGGAVDWVEAFAIPFALRCQCAFLGWPASLAEPIRAWTQKNHDAILANDRSALDEIADEFHAYVRGLLDARRGIGAEVHEDVTTSLMRSRVNGAPLTDQELTSILRNWTVGEVGSLASAMGILVHHLATHRALQERLRRDPSLLAAAIEEILRVSGPLVLNRRRATRAVVIGGRRIAAGSRVSLMWIGANRDPEVFEEPTEARIERVPEHNLLWGAGIHVCPGAPLAQLEMRVALEELLSRGRWVELSDREAPRRAVYPANGWASLPVRLT